MIRVMLIDDERSVLNALELVMEDEGDLDPVSFTDPVAAMHTLRNDPPDILVLDRRMKPMDGMSVLRSIRERSTLPVIFLSEMGDDEDITEGLELGADDYVSKRHSHKVLVQRIRAVLRRTHPVAADSGEGRPRSLRVGDLRVLPDERRCLWKGSEVRLTATEFRIVEYLAEAPRSIRSRASLMEAAYGDLSDLDDPSERRIDSHIRRIRRNFEAVDLKFKGIRTRYGDGYALDVD